MIIVFLEGSTNYTIEECKEKHLLMFNFKETGLKKFGSHFKQLLLKLKSSYFYKINQN